MMMIFQSSAPRLSVLSSRLQPEAFSRSPDYGLPVHSGWLPKSTRKHWMTFLTLLAVTTG